ncbi:hypothetical protein ACQKPX_14130 [Photobacterium sp. DNB23_23_1]
MLNKIISMAKPANLFNHILVDDVDDAVNIVFIPRISFCRVKKYSFDIIGNFRLKAIKTSYRQNNYVVLINLVNKNIGFLIKSQRSEDILLAALAESDELQRIKFMILAVLADTSCLNKVTFSVLLSKIENKSYLLLSLRSIVDNCKEQNDFQRYVLSVYLDYKVETYRSAIDFDSLTANQKVFLYYIESKYEELIRIYSCNNLNNLSKSSVNYIFEAAVKLKDFKFASKILQLFKKYLSNKNINEYWFAKGELVEGFRSMRERDMSSVFRQILGSKYIQSLSSLDDNEALLVLSSWGPGDDIRYSSMFPAIKAAHPNVTFSCEPRLVSLFSRVYQDINITPVSRTKRIMHENSFDFSHQPHHKIHHVLDKNSIGLMANFDRITLMTDMLSDFVEPGENAQFSTKRFEIKDLKTENIINSFIDSLKVKKRPIIGICWRSMVQSHSRNTHYYSVEDLSVLFKIPNCVFVSLQYDHCIDEIEKIKTLYSTDIYIPPIDQLNDFESVLYLMRNLDLVVSAGTAVLEIAGLSGIETLALTNSEAQRYRVYNNKDLWFPNISYIPGCIGMDRSEVISKVADSILENYTGNQ